MNKTLIILLGFALLMGCDKIAPDERLIAVETTPSEQNILLIEYTGWLCLNCPRAAASAKKLKEEYSEKVVIVGMHAYNNSFNDPGATGPDFRTEEATAYSEYFGVSALPAGSINQKSFNGNILQDYTSWIACAQQEIQTIPSFSLQLTCRQSEFNARNIQIETAITQLKELEGNPELRLQLWLTESNIIAPQILPNGQASLEYVHEHVLRGAVNGVWGESIDLVYEEGSLKKEVSYRLDSSWKNENCSIVAFIYRVDNKEVQQVAELKLK